MRVEPWLQAGKYAAALMSQIPKRNGTTRIITAPKRTLKAAQRWALRNVFERLPVHGAAHGFLPGRS